MCYGFIQGSLTGDSSQLHFMFRGFVVGTKGLWDSASSSWKLKLIFFLENTVALQPLLVLKTKDLEKFFVERSFAIIHVSQYAKTV